MLIKLIVIGAILVVFVGLMTFVLKLIFDKE